MQNCLLPVIFVDYHSELLLNKGDGFMVHVLLVDVSHAVHEFGVHVVYVCCFDRRLLDECGLHQVRAVTPEFEQRQWDLSFELLVCF